MELVVTCYYRRIRQLESTSCRVPAQYESRQINPLDITVWDLLMLIGNQCQLQRRRMVKWYIFS